MSSESAILEEIARLSNVIEKAKAGHNSTPQYHHPNSFVPRGRGSGRGFRGGAGVGSRGGRGGGRGGGRDGYSGVEGKGPTVLHRNAKWVAPKIGDTSATTKITTTKTTTTNGTINSTPSNSNSATPPPFTTLESRNTSASIPILQPLASSSKLTTMPSRGGFKNRTLALRSGGLPLAVPTTTTPQAGPTEVVIDGVTFVSDPRGNKLVRKPGAPSIAGSSTSTDSSTPKRTSISGTTYIRTKTGNLISLEFAKKRRDANEKKEVLSKNERLDRMVGIVKDVQSARDGNDAGSSSARGRGGRGRATRGRGRGGRGRGGLNAFVRPRPKRVAKLCKFFQKTGQCNNGLTCPYTHDSNKVAICPLSLRNKCPNKSTTCPLSHTPTPNRSPHCTHFPNCTKGPSCLYTHSPIFITQITQNKGGIMGISVCDEFAKMGWCPIGLECKLRHAFECPEFSEKGLCTTLGCKLPHILRRRNEQGVEEESDDDNEEEVVEGDEEDELKEGEIDWDAGGVGEISKGKKRRIDDEEGTNESVLSLKRRTKKVKNDLANNSDFVTFEDEEEEYEDEDEEEEEIATDEEGDDEVAAAPTHANYEDYPDDNNSEDDVEDFLEFEEPEEPDFMIDDVGIPMGFLYGRNTGQEGSGRKVEEKEEDEEDDFDPDQLLH